MFAAVDDSGAPEDAAAVVDASSFDASVEGPVSADSGGLVTADAGFAVDAAEADMGRLGCLDLEDNRLNTVNATLEGHGISIWTFEVCSIPPDRPRVLSYVTSYTNRLWSLTLVDPSGIEHTDQQLVEEPTKKSTYFNLPAELGVYTARVTNEQGGRYTYFFGAIPTSDTGFGAP